MAETEMRPFYYLIDKQLKIATPCTADEWTQDLINGRERTWARIALDNFVPGIDVSTVFLGSDHQHFGGEPLLYETLVTGGPFDGYMVRYSLWGEAEAGHNKMVEVLHSKGFNTLKRWHRGRCYAERIYKKRNKKAETDYAT